MRALGAGLALTRGVAQASVGALWTKHDVLRDVSVGATVPEGTAVRTRETYGAPRLFVGLSLVGMPPFVR